MVVVVVPGLRDRALGLFEGVGGGTELVGEGETRFMVAGSAGADVHQCRPLEGSADQRCDGLKFAIIDAARMPFITRNQCQGGTLSTQYRAAGIRDGDDFLVVIINPDQIASGPFQGVDIAKDRACG